MGVIRARRWPRTKAVHASTSDRLKKDHPESEHKSALRELTPRLLSLLCVAENTHTFAQTGLYRVCICVYVCVCARALKDRSVKSRGSSHQLARSCLSYGVSNALWSRVIRSSFVCVSRYRDFSRVRILSDLSGLCFFFIYRVAGFFLSSLRFSWKIYLRGEYILLRDSCLLNVSEWTCF